MEPTSLGYDVIVDSWLEALPPLLLTATSPPRVELKRLCDSYLFDSLSFVRRHITEPLPSVNNGLVNSLLKMISCFMVPFVGPFDGGAKPKPKTGEIRDFCENLEGIFLFALTWSVLATADTQGRKMCDRFLRNLALSNGCKVFFPSTGSIYDYTFDQDASEWRPWESIMDEYRHNVKLSFAEMIIPTMDTVRYTYLLELLVTNNMHVLMTGPTGTGKTVNINRWLSTEAPKNYVPLTFTFSARTSANMTQDVIDGKCEKRRKGVYGPMAGQRFVLFIDDINMPLREEYGAQPPIELLRQWVCASGWYDLVEKSHPWRTIIDTTMVAACGPPGGGKQPVTDRFFRHFNIIGYTALSDSVMHAIYTTILGEFLKAGFSEDCIKLTNSLVESSVVVFNRIGKELLPTPAKSHYTFNLRDLGKVFQGMLMTVPASIRGGEDLARLWVHESRRVYQDRLISEEDVVWFDNVCEELVTEHMPGLEWSDVIPKRDALIFCDYLQPGADPLVYEEAKDLKNVFARINEELVEYNAEMDVQMNLVMFIDAIKHVSRISRVIRQPQGNALLLGVGGSGRQSLTRLAAYVAKFECRQVSISKGYGQEQWREDLKEALMNAGVANVPTVFLFVDTQIVFEGMLEDVNNVLNAGDVPNIYNMEDEDAIINTCRADCIKKRLLPTKLNIFSQYIIRVRSNIHIVLAMSPVGDSFSRRIRMFPSIVNCCTIDWFFAWPNDALRSVATQKIADADLDLLGADEKVIELFVDVHQSVYRASDRYRVEAKRYNYVTPTSYLQLLSTYQEQLQLKRDDVGTKKMRLEKGYNKIVSTEGMVAGLKETLIKMQPQLQATQTEVDAMIVNITKETKSATETKDKMQIANARASKKSAAAVAIAQSAQKDLDKALPALDAAVECLSLLDKKDIDEMSKYKIAPYGVKLTMEVTCIMFHVKAKMVKDPSTGKKTKDWFGAARTKLLGNAASFKRKLIDYDRDNMADDIVEKLATYVEMDAFTPENVRKASVACEAVCKWAHAMYVYHTVSKTVEPKRIALKAAEDELAEVMAVVEDAKAKLNAVEARIHTLETTYESSLQKKDRLALEVKQTTTRLTNAGKLIASLGSEKVRWKETVAKLIVEYDNLVGDVVIAAGTIAYLGPFTPTFRQNIVDGWRQKARAVDLSTSGGANIIMTLAKPVVVEEWHVLGLPSDSHSVENAVSMSCASRWSLCIDPQGQANAFIKALGSHKNGAGRMGVVTNRNKTVLVRTIENAIRNGTWVLLEDIEESLDAAIEPVLQRSTFKEKGQVMMKIGENNVPYNDAFRFFMTTKLPNPHYPPEVCVKVTLLNFTITPKGLEEQLLGVVTHEEMPELEEKKTELTHQNASMNKNLDHLETETLRLLAASGDDILDNVELISTLENSKSKSVEIAIAMKSAAETELKIDTARERFRVVATRGSVLYFTIADLFRICDMYQYSLQWFVEAVFVHTLRKSEPSTDVEVRKSTLIEAVTYSLYDNICRSLFVRHKLLLSFMITANIMQNAGTLDLAVWRFIMSGQVTHDDEHGIAEDAPNPDPDWLEEQGWQEIKMIDSLKQFAGFAEDFASHLPEWRGYYESAEPQTMMLPGQNAQGVSWDSLSSLEKLCILRALRPEKVLDGIQLFVISQIGRRYVDPPPFNLALSYAASTKMIPLIFVLTSGSDPGEELLEFAKKKHMDDKILKLSLGQGQDKVAEAYIEKGVRDGNWVYLQNCHLYASWMPSLARIAGSFKPDDIADDFRLWLTSMPSPVFPVSVLQSGLKITMEPPKGLRSNLLNAYSKLDDDMLERTNKPFEYKKLLFALSFFHATVQARRAFGSLGWNRPYAFNDTDLSISKSQAERYIDLYPEEVPYKVLIFLTSYINYGGRVTDYIDLRTIDVIMREMFKPEVLNDDFKFSESGIYYSCPVAEDECHASYMEYISSLPLNPTPEAFGMHDNAEITCARNETYSLFSTILTLQAGGGDAGGFSRDELLLTMCETFMERMPLPFDIEQVTSLYPLMYTESMNTVLAQECLRYNKLVREIRRTLPQLARAVKGLVVMSGELDTMANALLVQAVPQLWQNKAYPCLKALSGWMDELQERLVFIQTWIDSGTPKCFWISGFYFPQAFLTGSRQNYARKTTFPIDEIEFEFIIQRENWESVPSSPEDGVYIRGLFIEGARWNMEIMSIDDSHPKKLFVEAPMLWCKPVRNYVRPTTGVYRMPVYKILSRWGILATTGHSSNFIMWIEMPSNRDNFVNNLGFADQKEWIKAGVAAFCSLRH
jgi:dynein heavy chain